MLAKDHGQAERKGRAQPGNRRPRPLRLRRTPSGRPLEVERFVMTRTYGMKSVSKKALALIFFSGIAVGYTLALPRGTADGSDKDAWRSMTISFEPVGCFSFPGEAAVNDQKFYLIKVFPERSLSLLMTNEFLYPSQQVEGIDVVSRQIAIHRTIGSYHYLKVPDDFEHEWEGMSIGEWYE